MKVSETSVRDILDIIEISKSDETFDYTGRLDEVNFLSRIFNLKEIKSNDCRYNNMYDDIIQHTIRNNDWEDNWIFYDERLSIRGKNFIKFIEEIFHPAVRIENQSWRLYINKINNVLKYDKLKLGISSDLIDGREKYKFTRLSSDTLVQTYLLELRNQFSSKYIDSQVNIMLACIDSNPNVAIGKAKELIESCSKTILLEINGEYDKTADLPTLTKQAMKAIGLSAKEQDKSNNAGMISAKILGSLNSIPHGMAELRNEFGDGHGKESTFISLPPRYARLAVGTATTLVNFMWDTFQDKKLNL
ncbi:abortive infection family protein [Macrococcus epidermidis]|uniref:abortive infection family protein n=1 Tax=Macrococcus epidermidis TaxID=1902580 RepID=UPI0020B79A78|nr:abortive infection family protein [Macrococcus epidermidis]UTH16251.1 abortive infection family protein [Macrococcus epidermidis]